MDENLRVIFDRTSGDGFTETATGVSWKTYPSKWVVSYLSNGNNAMHMKSPSPLSDSTSTKWMTVWINGGSMGRYNTASQVGSGVIITRGACDIEW